MAPDKDGLWMGCNITLHTLLITSYPPGKIQCRGTTRGFESEDLSVWKVLEAKGENILSNVLFLLLQTIYLLLLPHSSSLCSQYLSHRPPNPLPPFENKTSVGLKTRSDRPTVVNEVKSHSLEGSSCPGAEEQPCGLPSFNSWFPKAPMFVLAQYHHLWCKYKDPSISRLAALAWAAATIQISIFKLGLKPVIFSGSTAANTSKCSCSSVNFPAICPKGHACSKTVTINLDKGEELKATEAS